MGGEQSFIAHNDGAVELYYDASLKLATLNDGVSVTGHVKLGDDSQLSVGASNDCTLSHSSTYNNTLIYNGTGDFYIRTGTAIHFQNKLGSENYATFVENGSVHLYHDSNEKIKTTTYGTATTGYNTQSTAIGYQGDNADWTSSISYTHLTLPTKRIV